MSRLMHPAHRPRHCRPHCQSRQNRAWHRHFSSFSCAFASRARSGRTRSSDHSGTDPWGRSSSACKHPPHVKLIPWRATGQRAPKEPVCQLCWAQLAHYQHHPLHHLPLRGERLRRPACRPALLRSSQGRQQPLLQGSIAASLLRAQKMWRGYTS
jgi:hypothetical protein